MGEDHFGRDRDVAVLLNHLTITPGDSFALIGGRRIGKTSTLEALSRSLSTSLEKEGTSTVYLPIFIDFSGEGINSTLSFFRSVCEEVRYVLSKELDVRFDQVPTLGDKYPPAPAFRHLMLGWERSLKAYHNSRLRLILLLDECEQITGKDWTSDFYAALRYLLVGQATRSIIKVVMSGSHGFLNQVRQSGSPLRNVLKYHRLKVFDKLATHDLIIRPIDNKIPSDVVQIIAVESGGHPFLIQYLMHNLWEIGLEKVTIETVYETADNFSKERGDFYDWISSLGDIGVQVYRLLSSSDSGLSESQIRNILQPALSHIPVILEALCYYGIAQKSLDNDNYVPTSSMFRRWFRSNLVEKSEIAKNPKRKDFTSLTLEENIMHRLDEMQHILGEKLDAIKLGQRAIYMRLSPVDQQNVEAILMEVKYHRIELQEMHNTLNATRKVLQFIQKKGLPVNDDEVKRALSDIYLEVTSGLDISQQFELTLPVIPLLLEYKVALGADVDLGAAWKELVERIRK